MALLKTQAPRPVTDEGTQWPTPVNNRY